MSKEREILKQLVLDVGNMNIPNAEAAIRAAKDAEILFQGELDVIQKRRAEAEVSRTSEPGEDGPKDAPGVGESDTGKRKTTGTRGALKGSRSA